MQAFPSQQTPSEYRHKVAVPAPVSGKIIAFNQLDSILLSAGYYGPGFAISTSSNKVISPFGGEILTCDPLDYSVVIKASNGLKLKVKIGINTTGLMGEKCSFSVSTGQTVKQGQLLMHIVPAWLKQRGIEPVCIVTLLNAKKVIALTANAGRRCIALQDSLFTLYL